MISNIFLLSINYYFIILSFYNIFEIHEKNLF